MGQTQVSNGGIQPTILEPIQNLYTGSTIVFTVTVASKDSTHRYNGQGSSNGYKIDGKFAPFIVLTPGITYKFDQADSSNSNHPLRFYKDAAKVTAYTTNVTTNGTAGSSGAYTQIVTGDATPTILYYQCSQHGFMGNAIQTNGLASSVPDDDSITTAKLANNAVTTAKIADDAVLTAKIADGAVTAAKMGTLGSNTVGTSQLVDQNVTLDKLPHGTSSNDGKFLRANNGADPTFETVTSTTINNNADNRVITGSSTANTLNGESLVTIDSSGRLSVASSAGGAGITLASQGATYGGTVRLKNTTSSDHEWMIGVGGGDGAYVAGRGLLIRDETTGANRFVISTSGKVGINVTNPDDTLDVNGTAEVTSNVYFGGDIYMYGNSYSGKGIFLGGSGSNNKLDDYEIGYWTPSLLPQNGSYASVTYNEQHGYYVKVGKQVTVWVRLRVTSMSSSGASGYLYIQGLPFTVASASSFNTSAEGGTLAINYYSNLGSTDNKVPCGYSINNTTRIFMTLVGEGSSSSNANVTMFNAANAQVYGCMTYFTA